jgi:folate-binding protein YgfZ
MNQDWQQFLESRGARIDDLQRATFSSSGGGGNSLFALPQLGMVKIEGEDALNFLQGQFTNDVREVTDTHYQMSAYCTPKGRMLANFRLLKHRNAYLLQMPRDNLDSVMKRLPMFILMSKVSVQDVSDELVTIGLSGDDAKQLLQSHFTELPAQPGDTIQADGITILALPGDSTRFMLVGSPDELSACWSELEQAGANPTDSSHWELLDIRAGIPSVLDSTREAFIPQMTNMQLIDGVSFTKGCYTGQEVVARMKYLGKLKRRMYLARVESGAEPQPGDELFSPGSSSGQGAGRVVNVQPSPLGGYDLLAVVEIEQFDNNDLHLVDAQGPKLTFSQLPYGFEE